MSLAPRRARTGALWAYLFDIDPDPLTGKRQQANGSDFRTERAAWVACRAAMSEYEDGRRVEPSKRKVEDALNEWLTRIRHSIKPSMWQNWRDYADFYVIPHIGLRKVQDINGLSSMRSTPSCCPMVAASPTTSRGCSPTGGHIPASGPASWPGRAM